MRLLSIAELSNEIGLKVTFLRKAIKLYGLPYYRVGKCIKFRLNDVEEWVKQRRVE